MSSPEPAAVPAANASSAWLGPSTLRIAPWLIALKLLTLGLIAVAALRYSVDFNHRGYIVNYRGNHGAAPAGPPTADIVFRTWDAEHYLALAQHGYGGTGPRNAYYPLYPLLVRVVSPLCSGDMLSSALLVSNILGVLALLLLHGVIAQRTNARTADVSILLMCLQPAAFYTSLPYSESLFLCLIALLFGALQRGRLLSAGFVGALLVLTRPVGILVLLPIALHAWRAFRDRRDLRALVVCALPPLGMLAYLAIIGVQTGDPLTSFKIQKQFLAAAGMKRLLDPIGCLQSLFNVHSIHGYTDSLIDRLVFFVVFATLIHMLLRERATRLDWSLYTGLLAIVPAFSVIGLMSFTRYASVLFPSFVTLAEVLDRPQRRKWLVVVCIALACAQLWLMHRHVTFQWAA